MRVMTIVSLAAAGTSLALLTACPLCGCAPPVGAATNTAIVNGFGAAVDVVADGMVALSNPANGAMGVVPPQVGAHQLSVRPSATSVVPTQLTFHDAHPLGISVHVQHRQHPLPEHARHAGGAHLDRHRHVRTRQLGRVERRIA